MQMSIIRPGQNRKGIKQGWSSPLLNTQEVEDGDLRCFEVPGSELYNWISWPSFDRSAHMYFLGFHSWRSPRQFLSKRLGTHQ